MLFIDFSLMLIVHAAPHPEMISAQLPRIFSCYAYSAAPIADISGPFLRYT